ncbi:putative toxin biosynthesis protein [Pseudozyma hubeiensis SY62]|uniref:Putative toxin biosynthesis protein n=1 Tax=Pseudozyma hubeiensis (strain SY62) TaxID=1305764 RepID=R9PE80_PSEHS|nr:putative toxin biosynthesis protein [Pseudozyma hubeiensis SY62]GAC99562.1 putative toxin biosynthesis protein [Pseudozyma hubeiensis SY62]
MVMVKRHECSSMECGGRHAICFERAEVERTSKGVGQANGPTRDLAFFVKQAVHARPHLSDGSALGLFSAFRVLRNGYSSYPTLSIRWKRPFAGAPLKGMTFVFFLHELNAARMIRAERAPAAEANATLWPAEARRQIGLLSVDPIFLFFRCECEPGDRDFFSPIQPAIYLRRLFR